MAEAIEPNGANPEARPREKLGSLVQSPLHHAKCKLSASRSLSLSLSSGANVGKRKRSSGFCIRRSPTLFSIQSSKTSMTLGFIIVAGN